MRKLAAVLVPLARRRPGRLHRRWDDSDLHQDSFSWAVTGFPDASQSLFASEQLVTERSSAVLLQINAIPARDEPSRIKMELFCRVSALF